MLTVIIITMHYISIILNEACLLTNHHVARRISGDIVPTDDLRRNSNMARGSHAFYLVFRKHFVPDVKIAHIALEWFWCIETSPITALKQSNVEFPTRSHCATFFYSILGRSFSSIQVIRDVSRMRVPGKTEMLPHIVKRYPGCFWPV